MKVTVKLVGQKAGGREHVVAQASEGDPVLLVAEPDNKFDPHAVAVYTLPAGLLTGGGLSEDDRRLMMDRQAGYLPADVAARLTMPDGGIAGRVHNVRWHPPGHPQEGTPAGFDVLADLPLGARR